MIIFKRFYSYVSYGREAAGQFLVMVGRFALNLFAISPKREVDASNVSMLGQFNRFPLIDHELSHEDCAHCEMCLAACPTAALGWGRNEEIILNLSLCTRCAVCAEICPHSLIKMDYIPPSSIVEGKERCKSM